ncbi:MAG: glycosyltransferase [Thermodesulfobacteriota bacterium]
MRRKGRKLRILYIISIMPPYAGGAAVDYGIFVRGFNGRRFSSSVEKITVLTERGCRKDYGPSVEVRDILFNYDSAQSKSFLKQAANYLMILAYILCGRHDVVHIHARYVYARRIGRVLWAALMLSRSRAVVDIRDRFYDNFGWGPSFLVCSDSLKEYYSWIKGAAYIPVPLALPEVERRKPAGRHMAYFGTIAANKGVIELIEGFKRYSDGNDNGVELHIYGANSMGERFTREVDAHPRIRYFGAIPNPEVLHKIPGYHAVVLPSRSEGMPRVCLETIYCGRIIVCHRNIKRIIPCIPEEFVIEEITPAEFERVFASIEGVTSVSYDYDFTIHRPESVCVKLLAHYMETGARA